MKQMNEQTNRQTDEWMDRQTDRQTYTYTSTTTDLQLISYTFMSAKALTEQMSRRKMRTNQNTRCLATHS